MQVDVYVQINDTVNGNKARVKVCIDGDEIKVFNVWGSHWFPTTKWVL